MSVSRFRPYLPGLLALAGCGISCGLIIVFGAASRRARVTLESEVRIVPEAVDVAERLLVEDKLRQSQKMAAIGQLTSGVAHDFNNLLQVISANLHLIAKFAAGQAMVEQRVASARDAVDRGAKLANQLLALGRGQPLEPRVIGIGKIVAGMEDMLSRSLGDAVALEIIAPEGLWNTLVDPTQIENALLNLVINSRDAMSGAGRLTIELDNVVLDAAHARLNPDVASGPYVMLAVSDTGSGMTAEVAAQALEPFFTTKPAGQGTGLGLSMVDGFVKQSGGHIKICSEVGHGTTIGLYLPRANQPEDDSSVVKLGLGAGGSAA